MMVNENGKLAALGGEKTVTENSPAWPYFDDGDIEAVRECMLKSREDWRWACSAVGGGPAQELEELFQQDLGRKYALSTCGGGPALHIACMAAGIGLGDEVITTPYSWGQTTACILQAGGIPVFADISPETLTIDPESIEEQITEKTKAIVLVHIYGIPADMEPIMELADRYGLTVIADCAQAHGSRYNGQFVGTYADIACFSIGSGKNLAAGDAGMLVTEDRDLYEKALLAGMHPGRVGSEITNAELKERVDSLIYTYRISTFSAALACNQMKRLEEMNDWRRKNADLLVKELQEVPGITPLEIPEGSAPAYHIIPFTFVADEVPGVERHQYIKALSAEGVPVSGSYVSTPINLRRTFQQKEWWLGYGYPWKASERSENITYEKGDCPVAEKRCGEQDLKIGGGPWWKDVSPLIKQIGAAFRKVTANIEQLKDM